MRKGINTFRVIIRFTNTSDDLLEEKNSKHLNLIINHAYLILVQVRVPCPK